MFQKGPARSECSLRHAGEAVSRRRILATPQGTLFLQRGCTPSLVERLRAESGLRAFARRPEREYQLLLHLAGHPECVLTLAYTESGEIVGQVTLAPADAWWEGLANTYEIALEVSSSWRRLGIGRQLVTLALELPALEQFIVLALGLSWHWDTEGLGLSPSRYRALIAHLFAAHDFAEYLTCEPNIQEDPANILLVRIGSQVEQQAFHDFLTRLLAPA